MHPMNCFSSTTAIYFLDPAKTKIVRVTDNSACYVWDLAVQHSLTVMEIQAA